MPNHYTTRVTVYGNEADLLAFRQKHIIIPDFEDDPEAEQFDFNTVIPQPEGINDTISASDMPKTVDGLLAKLVVPLTDEERRSFTHHLHVLQRTGYANWYDWNNANWGTKWNSYDYAQIRTKQKNLFKFKFDTAWAPPIPVLKKLVEDHPELKIYAVGRDEFERKWTDLTPEIQ